MSFKQPTVLVRFKRGIARTNAYIKPNFRKISAAKSKPLGSQQGYVVMSNNTFIPKGLNTPPMLHAVK